MSDEKAATISKIKPWHVILPLALAQLINSYDTTAMNVAVSKVVTSLDTTVSGVQAGITIYSLIMAACMLIGAKLGDIWGRRRAFLIGVALYGVGALITSLSQNLGMMVAGWSLLEGLGSALMIPAIFAMVGSIFPPGKDRLKGYAIIGSAAAAGAALGPLLCGFWATYVTWRASFISEVIVVIVIFILSRNLGKQPEVENKPHLDVLGAILSALGLVFTVIGFLQASVYGWVTARIPVQIGSTVLIAKGGISPVIPFICIGIIILIGFVFWEIHCKRINKQPLIDLGLLKSRAASLGLLTVMAMMFMQAGLLFVTPVFLQMSLGLSPIMAGLTILPMTVFLIVFSQLTAKLTSRFSPRTLIRLGMLLMPIGIILIWLMLSDKPSAIEMVPGFIIIGIGIGFANAPLLNVVQSSAPSEKQGEISGLNRAISNLGGSLGTAVAGAVLITVLISSFSGLIMSNNVVPQPEKERIEAALDKDARTVSNAEAEKYLAEKSYQTDIKNALFNINQTARNKALLYALLAIGIIGIIGFIFSLFLPKSNSP